MKFEVEVPLKYLEPSIIFFKIIIITIIINMHKTKYKERTFAASTQTLTWQHPTYNINTTQEHNINTTQEDKAS